MYIRERNHEQSIELTIDEALELINGLSKITHSVYKVGGISATTFPAIGKNLSSIKMEDIPKSLTFLVQKEKNK